LFVRSFDNVDVENMRYGLQITFRQLWVDPRLQYSAPSLAFVTVPLKDMEKVWKPDTFFRNSLEGRKHGILQDNSYIRIFPNGSVLYSQRLFLTLSCPMDLRRFPFQSLECKLQIASYGYTKKDIVYSWRSSDPVQLVRSLYMPGYYLSTYKSDYCDVTTSTGEYSCLNLVFGMEKPMMNEVIRMLLPFLVCVLVSMCSLWIPRKEVLARLGLVITSLYGSGRLALDSNLPAMAYPTAAENWMGFCIFFMFCLLLEILVVNFFHGTTEKSEEKSSKTPCTEILFRILNPVILVIFLICYTVSYSGDSRDWEEIQADNQTVKL